MTSRRLIRIKVIQLLYSYTKKEGATILEVERDLFKSIEKTTDLYYHVFLLITEIQRYSFLKIDAAKLKRLPSHEDLHPNTRFIDNPVILQIAENRKFKTYVSQYHVSFSDRDDIVATLFNKLQETEFFQEYMEKDVVSYEDDKKLVLNMMSEIFADSEELEEVLEDKNIYWNDDIEFALSIAYKTVKNMKESYSTDTNYFISLYNPDEDFDFAKNLLRKSILEMNQDLDMIDKHVENWELDRISDIDKIIMVAAISELKYCTSIPIKVTLDEYIEIAKFYCAAKSSSFINGVLDKVVVELTEKNEIKKVGRGLM